MLGSAVLALSVALGATRLWTALRSPSSRRAAEGVRALAHSEQALVGRMWKPFVGLAALASYLVVLPKLGYVLATPPLVAVLVILADRDWGARRRRWVAPVVVACVLTVATHILFDALLGVLLPSGLFDPSWGL